MKKISLLTSLGLLAVTIPMGYQRASAQIETPTTNSDKSHDESGAPIKLVFSNVTKKTGKIWISICTRAQHEDRSNGKQVICTGSAKIPAAEGAEYIFDDIPAGTYVATAFHDEDDNGQLDFDTRGIPFEATGNGVNAVGNFGPPTFDQMKFRLLPASDDPAPMVFTIRLYNAGG